MQASGEFDDSPSRVPTAPDAPIATKRPANWPGNRTTAAAKSARTPQKKPAVVVPKVEEADEDDAGFSFAEKRSPPKPPEEVPVKEEEPKKEDKPKKAVPPAVVPDESVAVEPAWPNGRPATPQSMGEPAWPNSLPIEPQPPSEPALPQAVAASPDATGSQGSQRQPIETNAPETSRHSTLQQPWSNNQIPAGESTPHAVMPRPALPRDASTEPAANTSRALPAGADRTAEGPAEASDEGSRAAPTESRPARPSVPAFHPPVYAPSEFQRQPIAVPNADQPDPRALENGQEMMGPPATVPSQPPAEPPDSSEAGEASASDQPMVQVPNAVPNGPSENRPFDPGQFPNNAFPGAVPPPEEPTNGQTLPTNAPNRPVAIESTQDGPAAGVPVQPSPQAVPDVQPQMDWPQEPSAPPTSQLSVPQSALGIERPGMQAPPPVDQPPTADHQMPAAAVGPNENQRTVQQPQTAIPDQATGRLWTPQSALGAERPMVQAPPPAQEQLPAANQPIAAQPARDQGSPAATQAPPAAENAMGGNPPAGPDGIQVLTPQNRPRYATSPFNNSYAGPPSMTPREDRLPPRAQAAATHESNSPNAAGYLPGTSPLQATNPPSGLMPENTPPASAAPNAAPAADAAVTAALDSPPGRRSNSAWNGEGVGRPWYHQQPIPNTAAARPEANAPATPREEPKPDSYPPRSDESLAALAAQRRSESNPSSSNSQATPSLPTTQPAMTNTASTSLPNQTAPANATPASPSASASIDRAAAINPPKPPAEAPANPTAAASLPAASTGQADPSATAPTAPSQTRQDTVAMAEMHRSAAYKPIAASPGSALPEEATKVPPAGQLVQTASPRGETPSSDQSAGVAPLEGAQIMARVGSEVILASEVMAPINEMLAGKTEGIPPEIVEEQRKKLAKERLKQLIETKLVYLDAKRDIPTENFPKVETKVNEFFDREEIEKMMKRAKVDSRAALDEKLHLIGTSLERERRAFIERTLAQQWIRQKLKIDEEISHEEIRNYYRDHAADFDRPAQARWEEIMVRFSKYPDKAAAYDAIAQLGNKVMSGNNFAEVAKAGSDGATAASGGVREWTNQKSLVSEELDQAIFGLPIGALSQIIETKQGFHIVRVVERKEAGRVPFTEAQVTIRSKIREERGRKELQEYLDGLRTKIPVWTIYDDPVSSAENAKRRKTLVRQ